MTQPNGPRLERLLRFRMARPTGFKDPTTGLINRDKAAVSGLIVKYVAQASLAIRFVMQNA